MLSVIVPVYNVEKFLSRCIESIVNQTYDEVELILVDDGSSDSSGRICDEYASKYKNVKAIHQNNSGVVCARKIGCNHAVGDYISFVDGDDWLDLDFFKYYMKKIQETRADIVVTGFVHDENEIICIKEKPKKMSKKQAINALFEWKIFRWELCGKIYRASLIRNEFFNDKICMGEDLDLNWELFKSIKMLYYDPARDYHYRRNEYSATNDYNTSKRNEYVVVDKIINDGGFENPIIAQRLSHTYIGSIYARVRELIFSKPLGYDICIKKLLKGLDERREIFDKNIFKVSKYALLFCGYDECVRKIAECFKEMEKTICSVYTQNDVSYIYGTGVVSYFVTQIIIKHGFGFDGYVVSDGERKRKEFYNHPVYYLNEICHNKHILIAVGEKNRVKIYKNIKKRGCDNISYVIAKEIF